MARAVLQFNEQLERVGEVIVVVLVGALLRRAHFDAHALWFVPLLLLAVRPLAVLPVLPGTRTSWTQRWLMSWFGIRGIGSIYYLLYAVNHGIEPVLATKLIGLTLAVVTVSIVAHGISVTPLMKMYQRLIRVRHRRAKAVGA
jgi:NhaP-type Na+/H+ or K+/H+ antiporter